MTLPPPFSPPPLLSNPGSPTLSTIGHGINVPPIIQAAQCCPTPSSRSMRGGSFYCDALRTGKYNKPIHVIAMTKYVMLTTHFLLHPVQGGEDNGCAPQASQPTKAHHCTVNGSTNYPRHPLIPLHPLRGQYLPLSFCHPLTSLST